VQGREQEEPGLSIFKGKVSPFQAGLVLGLGAALVQAYFKVIPPLAYGVCMVCHPRDLFNWLADHLLGLDWKYSLASTNWPLLTVVGVILGSMTAAALHKELRLQAARQPLSHFINGFLMINLGLIIGSCPIRIVLLSAYGSLGAVFTWLCIIAGVGFGTWFMRWNARRLVERKPHP
jgi:hypothetical protein